MSNKLLRRVALVVIGTGLCAAASVSVQADFIVGGFREGVDLKLNNDEVNKNGGTTGTGTVDGHIVAIETFQESTFASGSATIKAARGQTLNSITFTPEDMSLFDAFSFRGQLRTDGNVVVTVMDNFNEPTVFTFEGIKANQDFRPISIRAKQDSGETIKFVIVTGNFKEQKQNEFRYAPVPVPEPTTMIAGGLLLLPLGVSALRVLRKKSAV